MTTIVTSLLSLRSSPVYEWVRILQLVTRLIMIMTISLSLIKWYYHQCINELEFCSWWLYCTHHNHDIIIVTISSSSVYEWIITLQLVTTVYCIHQAHDMMTLLLSLIIWYDHQYMTAVHLVKFSQCRYEVSPFTGVLKTFQGFFHLADVGAVLWVAQQLTLLYWQHTHSELLDTWNTHS